MRRTFQHSFFYLCAFSILGSAGLQGCLSAEDEPTVAADGARGPLGKADAAGSCSFDDGNYCDGQASSGCWCDDECEQFGDCCSDYQPVCLGDDGETGGESTDDGGDTGNDVAGELAFDLHELSNGWYQYYEGSVQYRPSGEFFATSMRSDGQAHVFHKSGYSSSFINWTGLGTSWAGDTLNPGTSYYLTALAGTLDQNDRPVALIGGQDYQSTASALHVFRYDGYKWDKLVPFMQLGGATYPRGASVRVDATGDIHVVYSGRTPSQHNYVDGVMYARFDGSAWINELIEAVPVASEQRTVQLELDAQGRAHVVYVQRVVDPGPNDTANIIKYAVRDAGGWTTGVAESYILARPQIDLAVTPAGKPFIVYSDAKNSDIFLTEFEDGAWVRDNVVSANDVGWGTSVALDDLGRPHITWYDRTANRLGYGRRLASGWDLYPEMAAPHIRHHHRPSEPVHTDLVVDADRLPHITAGAFDLVTVEGHRN